MIKNILLPSIICFFLFSCKGNKKASLTHEVTIGNILVMNVPDEMKFVENKGIDSNVAYLISEKNDTFHIEYGSKGIIFDLHSISPAVFSLNQKETIIKTSGKEPSPDEVVFSEYPEEDREQKIFDRNYFLYDTVNKIIVKLVQPKRVGDGVTGLYVPKLKDGKSFSIYAKNLDSTSHHNALQFFKTIRYKQ
jgi:hypothetical protein